MSSHANNVFLPPSVDNYLKDPFRKENFEGINPQIVKDYEDYLRFLKNNEEDLTETDKHTIQLCLNCNSRPLAAYQLSRIVKAKMTSWKFLKVKENQERMIMAGFSQNDLKEFEELTLKDKKKKTYEKKKDYPSKERGKEKEK